MEWNNNFHQVTISIVQQDGSYLWFAGYIVKSVIHRMPQVRQAEE